MATEDDELYEELKGVLFNDSAVAGEAAALSMGLVMLGSASAKGIEEMIGYAHDTAVRRHPRPTIVTTPQPCPVLPPLARTLHK